MSADDEGTGGAPAAAPESLIDAQPEEESTIAGRPEYIPEKYWDDITGRARVEDLGKGYIELASKLGQRDDKMKEEMSTQIKAEMREGVPGTAEEYIYTPSEGIVPEGMAFNLDKENEQYVEFGKTAHNLGLNQEQFNSVMDLYVRNEMAYMPDKKAELTKLGDNGQARIERIDLWAKANLTEQSYNSVVKQATSGEFIIAMEELIRKTGSSDLEGQGDMQKQGPLDRGELEQMMRDPKYRDPRHRDDAFVRRVEEGFKALRH
tara:strand:+ start:682 stop:1470 length:789 start_codon:yes stop_codon:yes gene_type:complete